MRQTRLLLLTAAALCAPLLHPMPATAATPPDEPALVLSHPQDVPAPALENADGTALLVIVPLPLDVQLVLPVGVQDAVHMQPADVARADRHRCTATSHRCLHGSVCAGADQPDPARVFYVAILADTAASARVPDRDVVDLDGDHLVLPQLHAQARATRTAPHRLRS